LLGLYDVVIAYITNELTGIDEPEEVDTAILISVTELRTSAKALFVVNAVAIGLILEKLGLKEKGL
jgi:hypothetical protein